MPVNVISHKRQRYAVWFGGSLLASTVSFQPSFSMFILLTTFPQPEFYGYCHTKADYEEYGPSICRRYQIFASSS